jgi:hypothetical protein
VWQKFQTFWTSEDAFIAWVPTVYLSHQQGWQIQSCLNLGIARGNEKDIRKFNATQV